VCERERERESIVVYSKVVCGDLRCFERLEEGDLTVTVVNNGVAK
jgi:hypothetical protein